MPRGGREIFDRARDLWDRARGHHQDQGAAGRGRYAADRGMRPVDRGWADMGDRGLDPTRQGADNDYSFMEWDRGAADLGNMRGGWSQGEHRGGWMGGGRGYDAGFRQGGPSRMGRGNLDQWGRMGRQDMHDAYVNRHAGDSGYQGGRYQRDLGMRGYGADFGGRGYGRDFRPGGRAPFRGGYGR